MKKIIFLFCLFVMFIPSKVYGMEELSCDTSTFDIVEHDGDLLITKRGENPFMMSYSYDGKSVSVTGVSCGVNGYSLYGYASRRDGDNFYDTFLLVLDYEGNVIYEEVMDYGENEEITGVVFVDQVMFTIVRIDDLGDRINEILPEFRHFIVRTYDSNYNFLQSKQITDYIHRYETTDDLVLLYYTYQGPVDLGLDTLLNEYNGNDYLDVQESYLGSMKLSFINQGYLNNEPVVNGLDIDYPGVYNLMYDGHEYRFVVNPRVEGVRNLETYDQAVTPVISSGNATLNGDAFISGTPISNPGNYTLVITGINGYKKTYEFTIVPKVEGVINGHSYKEPFVITFDGEGYLNNSLVTSPVQIKDDGDYVFRVNGVGGLSDSYEFTFYQPQSTITAQEVIQKIDIFLLVIAIVIGVILIKKK